MGLRCQQPANETRYGYEGYNQATAAAAAPSESSGDGDGGAGIMARDFLPRPKYYTPEELKGKKNEAKNMARATTLLCIRARWNVSEVYGT